MPSSTSSSNMHRPRRRTQQGSDSLAVEPDRVATWADGNSALEHAVAALEIADQAHYCHQRIFKGRIKALIETDFGRLDLARASAEDGLRLAEERSHEVNVFTCLGVLGRLELALGNLEAAGARLRDFPARALAARLQRPDGSRSGPTR